MVELTQYVVSFTPVINLILGYAVLDNIHKRFANFRFDLIETPDICS